MLDYEVFMNTNDLKQATEAAQEICQEYLT